MIKIILGKPNITQFLYVQYIGSRARTKYVTELSGHFPATSTQSAKQEGVSSSLGQTVKLIKFYFLIGPETLQQGRWRPEAPNQGFLSP